MTELAIGALLYKTQDFDVTIGVSDAKDLPTELKRLFFVTHRASGVVHGRSNLLSDALYGAEKIQKELDQAIANPKKPPDRELTSAEQAMLMGMAGASGARN